MNIKKLLTKKYGAFPLKKLGQVFLIDKKIIKKIIKSADLKEKDIVLEVGPGVGNLTQEIAKKVKKTIIVEKDPRMIEILKNNLENFKNIKIIKGDILKLETKKMNIKKYKIVANIPYYLTFALIRKFLEKEKQPEVMVLMVQKEVAQRICAKPPKMTLLSVSVQFYANVGIISYVSKNSFWPKPKVDSAILKIVPKSKKLFVDSNLFFKIVKAGFSQPRKQLVNNLSKKLKLNKEKIRTWFLKNNIQPNQRAQSLSLKDWLKLTKTWYNI